MVHDRLSAYESVGLPLDQALANEDRHGREVIANPDFAEGVAGFLANQGARREQGAR